MRAEDSGLQQQLVRLQNPDGGWPYQNKSSWTEPTALALLALECGRGFEFERRRGFDWLVRHQNADGGWRPNPAVPISTWVTALAVFALSDHPEYSAPYERGLVWLSKQSSTEPSLLERLAYGLRGETPSRPNGGYSWFPGTASWVTPTALAILALSDAIDRKNEANLRQHLERGREFLLARRCRDGGWNHGGSKYRSENANSYPETTGLALLALPRQSSSELRVPLALANLFQGAPESVEGWAWLRMALAKHGAAEISDVYPRSLRCRSPRDLALLLLGGSAKDSRNRFVRILA